MVAAPLLGSLMAARLLAAQPPAEVATVRTVGSPSDEAWRVAQLRGARTDGLLLRGGVTITDASPDALGRTRATVLWPHLRTVYNGALATSRNEGALWSGRGMSTLLRGGVALRLGPLHATIAPELTYSGNRPVETFAGGDSALSRWSSPWRTPQASADLPVRFGDMPWLAIRPGQSRVELEMGAAAVGIATENLWWGPALRNALLVSNHADGVPHLLLRTRRPIGIGAGVVEARWMAGVLTESLYFDRDRQNDRRAMGGLVVAWSPRPGSGVTLGLMGLAVRSVEIADGAPSAGPLATGGAVAALHAAVPVGNRTGSDVMQGAFLRWVFFDDGAEVWGEYAVMEQPSLREWLVAPNANAGWTVGAQWLVPTPRRSDATWRLQFELTDVAQSQVLPGREPRDWGTGRTVSHGFTHRGRLLGVSTGPGSSHGWLLVERWHPSWTLGGYGSRTRWENDALYRQAFPHPFAHDVSLEWGVRASASVAGWWSHVTVGMERRFNYQFESSYLVPLRRGQRTVTNPRVEVTLSPGGA